MASAHIYRQALRWPDFGGAPLRALLLCPTEEGACPQWFDNTFQDTQRVGVKRHRDGTAGARSGLGDDGIQALL